MAKIKIIIVHCIGLIPLINLNQILTFLIERRNYPIYFDQFKKNTETLKLHFHSSGLYAWDEWSEKIRTSFNRAIPIYFLHQKNICYTMVYGNYNIDNLQKNKVEQIKNTFGNANVKKMLRESILGIPIIVNLKYLTSNNTIHQAYHLSSYSLLTGFNIINSNKIVEWGGGYGCMARLIRKVNQFCTYIIIDLPELCILQYIYLISIFGESEVNILNGKSDIIENKINIIPSDYFIQLKPNFKTTAFISNWAITESSKEYQDFVLDSDFFSAEKILISCVNDKNNHIILNSTKLNFKTIQIDILSKNNFYIVK
jgi:hypothetical protein